MTATIKLPGGATALRLPNGKTVAPPPTAPIVYVDNIPEKSLGERVERIKLELELDKTLALLPAVKEANALMGLTEQQTGPLPQQVSTLLAALGLYESDAARPGEYPLRDPAAQPPPPPPPPGPQQRRQG